MPSAAELGILLKARDEASATLARVGASVGGLNSKVGELAKVGLTAMTVATGAAVAASAAFAKAAADEEVGIVRLATAVRNAGGDWAVLGATVEGQIAKWERLTAFSDGEMRDALSMLTAQTGSVEIALKRLPVAMDFARGAGLELGAASKLLGKVTDDNVSVLSRYGISVEKGTSATELLAVVQKKFAGQSKAFAETTAGQWQIFANQLDNLKEDIGGVLLPTFTELGKVATAGLAWLRDSGTLDAFAGGLKTTMTVLGELFGVLTGRAPDAGAALKGVVGIEVATVIMQSLANIREMFKAVVAGDVPAIFATLKQRLPVVLGAVFDLVREAVPKIGAALIDWGRQFVAWVGPQIPPLLEEMRRLLGVAMRWLEDHAEEIGHAFGRWGAKMAEVIVTRWIPLLMEKVPHLQHALGNWILTELGPSLVRILIGVGQGVVSGLWSGISGAWDGLIANVKSAIAQIPDVVKRFLGIASPSTVFMEIGDDIMRGLAVGVQRSAHLPIAAVQGAIAALHPTAAKAVAAAPSIVPHLSGTLGTTGMQVGSAIVGPGGTVVYVTPHMAAGGSVTFMPNRHQGGYVPRTGPYFLEQGEHVISRNQGDGGGGLTIVNHFHGAVVGLQDVERVIAGTVTDVVRRGGFRGVLSTG